MGWGWASGMGIIYKILVKLDNWYMSRVGHFCLENLEIWYVWFRSQIISRARKLPSKTKSWVIPSSFMHEITQEFEVKCQHSQIHDLEVEHVVKPACVLLVSQQSTYKPSRNSKVRIQTCGRILPHHQL